MVLKSRIRKMKCSTMHKKKKFTSNTISNKLVQRPTAQQFLPKNELVMPSSTHDKTCMFCRRKESSEMFYGLLYEIGNVIVHFFCILLSAKSSPNGNYFEGVFGFLLNDVRTELSRTSRQLCYYCHKPGASISCCKSKCHKIFHLPCGLENGSMHQFYSRKSFCAQHRVTQTVDRPELQMTPISCGICREKTVFSKTSTTSLWAPCCKNNTWYHRKCIQEMALNTGFLFQCPICGNHDIFNKRMYDLGIYIPFGEAFKDTTPNIHDENMQKDELSKKSKECYAETCLSPFRDRKFFTDTGSWEFIPCHFCDSNGTHRHCSPVNINDRKWLCSTCHELIKSQSSNSTTNKSNEAIRISSKFFLKSTNARDTSQNETIVNILKPTHISDTILISDDDSDNDNISFTGIDLTLLDDSDA